MSLSPFRVGGPVTGEFFTDRAAEVNEIFRAMRHLLESIDRRRESLHKRVAIVLDEVQAVLSLNEEGADWFLRDLMQSVPEISLLCEGSHPSILEAMANDRYLRIWESLTSNQRLGLRALASGVGNLYAHDSGIPIAPSSLHRVVEALHSRRILMDGVNPEEIDDPFFRGWILRYAMPGSVPRDLL